MRFDWFEKFMIRRSLCLAAIDSLRRHDYDGFIITAIGAGYSFKHICHVLGIHPLRMWWYIRRQVKPLLKE